MTQEYHENSHENKTPELSDSLEANSLGDRSLISKDPASGGAAPSGHAGTGLSFDQMKTILEASPAGIGIVMGKVLGWANINLYAMLGYEQGSLEGKDAGILYPTPKEYERTLAKLTQGMEKFGMGVVETRLSRQDGTAFDCQIRASRMDPQNPKQGVVVVMTDISELKSLQTQLQQAQKMEAIGVLAGGISHDFNNILMGIQGHLCLMRISKGGIEKLNDHILQIGKLVDVAAKLTGRLLGFARGGKYQIEVLDINQLVAMSLNLFKPSRKDVHIRESYEADLHRVEGDRSQMEQVLLNLLINASQAMVDEGRMNVSTRNFLVTADHKYPFEVTPGPYVQISIQDNGIGMDEATQKKIFDPFFSTQEAGDEKGRGLGLSTVFGIVKNHGGFIMVKSNRGKGSTFNVCLPASSKGLDPDLKKQTSNLEQMLKGSETILLVDDEEEILNVGKNFLLKLGYKPLVARNGLEAVEIFKLYRQEISLVILDLIMPKMDGNQTFLQIREIKDQTRVLITSGHAMDEKVEALLNQGCHGFIQKPFSMLEFSQVVRSILDKKPS